MAHVTDLGFTMADLIASLDDGDVRYQTHPEFPELTVWNYTEEIQFRNKWNKITLACRGLILNSETGEVVARPWEKFFNLGQRDNTIDSDAPVEITDKMDGSLGILYRRPDKEWAIATRGSFTSEQAVEANKIWNESYAHLDVSETCTFLFEILVPWNRIVVQYDYDSEYLQQGRRVLPQGSPGNLVLLGAVDKRFGHYFGPREAAGMLNWTGPVTEVFESQTFVDAISNFPERKGKEGVVIRSGSKMVKLKQADYVELHRIVTNLSPKTIWDMLGKGRTVDSICAEIPDEFHQYVTDIGRNLLEQASDIAYKAQLDFGNCLMQAGAPSWPASPVNRREFASFATKSKNKNLLFLMLDGKPVDDVIWYHIKPRGDIKTLVKDEG